MPRTNSLYKERYNEILTTIATLEHGENLPPEAQMSKQHSVSRTTVRSVLEQLNKAQIIRWDGREKVVLRTPRKRDYFPVEETQTTSAKVENAFMSFLLNSDLKPGAVIRESDLVREIGVSASAIREFLIRFSSFGLIEKEPNRHWVLRGFTRAYADELFDVREVFEKRAFSRIAAQPLSDAHRAHFSELKFRHEELLVSDTSVPSIFGELDEKTHKFFIDHLSNRFVDGFFEVVSLIFHYHYRWNKSNEAERNELALEEHLMFINALLDGNTALAERSFVIHLASARRTLHESVIWES